MMLGKRKQQTAQWKKVHSKKWPKKKRLQFDQGMRIQR